MASADASEVSAETTVTGSGAMNTGMANVGSAGGGVIGGTTSTRGSSSVRSEDVPVEVSAAASAMGSATSTSSAFFAGAAALDTARLTVRRERERRVAFFGSASSPSPFAVELSVGPVAVAVSATSGVSGTSGASATMVSATSTSSAFFAGAAFLPAVRLAVRFVDFLAGFSPAPDSSPDSSATVFFAAVFLADSFLAAPVGSPAFSFSPAVSTAAAGTSSRFPCPATASRKRSRSAATTVDDADFTDTPNSPSAAINSFDVTPTAFARACTRILSGADARSKSRAFDTVLSLKFSTICGSP